ncbi:MAG: malonyl-ACP O-methyltransferase BioC [Prevotellaceae bacterium]|jgi:malonyl-ACP O-methyltransferase BioC|nr:malonyl-ACP O-methyltransferase BioC [Prevotellaceae bacterium]
MKIFWHKKEKNRQILVIFNGWGFDAKMFREIECNGHDIVSLYDYSELEFKQLDFVGKYDVVKILAWSFGVFVADFYAAHIANLAVAVAVNGSVSPVDNSRGIPEKIFLATLNSFNETNREKFYLRIAGGLSAYKRFAKFMPDRNSANQSAELHVLYQLALQKQTEGLKWNLAIVSENDKIFPLENLVNAWLEKGVKTLTIKSEHIPFADGTLSEILAAAGLPVRFFAPAENIRERRIKQAFGKSLDTYNDNADAQRKIAERLHSLVCDYCTPNVRNILEIGCGSGILTAKMLDTFVGAKFYLNDINEKVEICMRNLFKENTFEFMAGDAQSIAYPANIDMIVSSSTIQWFNRMQVFSQKAAKSLPSGARMFLSTFGKNNLREIRQITGTGLHYFSPVELTELFEDEFRRIHISEEEIPTIFDSPTDILVHLKNTGVNANSKGMFRTRKSLDLFCQKYRELFPDKSKVQLTYNPIYLILEKK